MSKIKYLQLIDELDNIAFEHCKKQLFNQLSYKVLEETDCRKIDLKESLLRYEEESGNYKKKNIDNSANRYANEIKFYLVNYVQCVAGSRAEKYKNRALKLIELVNEGKDEFDDLQDLTKIYITLMRQTIDDIKNNKQRTLSNVDFSLTIDDEIVLKELKEFEFKMPQGVVEQGIIKIAPTKFRKETKNFVEGLAKSKSKKDKLFTYVIAVIFYCRAMQKEGAYYSESEN